MLIFHRLNWFHNTSSFMPPEFFEIFPPCFYYSFYLLLRRLSLYYFYFSSTRKKGAYFPVSLYSSWKHTRSNSWSRPIQYPGLLASVCHQSCREFPVISSLRFFSQVFFYENAQQPHFFTCCFYKHCHWIAAACFSCRRLWYRWCNLKRHRRVGRNIFIHFNK